MPDALIASLTAAFAELRKLNEEGIVAYPYSTREIVAVAKHLEQYPEDGVVKTLENVSVFWPVQCLVSPSLRSAVA
jgi:von Willebrand factor A domain-containing protein 8